MTQLDIAREEAIRLGGPIALDSSALIAFLVREQPIGPLVAELVTSQAQLMLSAVVVSEAIVRVARFEERSFLESIVESLQVAPTIRIVPFGSPQIIETAIVRAQTGLKLPDAAIVATARIAGAIAILGNDRAWKKKSLGIQYIHLDDVVREYEEETR